MKTPSWSSQRGQLEWPIYLAMGRAISLTAFSLCLLAMGGKGALAQIVPDATLGAESSILKPNVEIEGLPSNQIDGGSIRGANLFHSFQEFNVGQGRGVYFTNPSGIENILTRVTGGNSSNIEGILGVLGNATLFLINPNGIIFGQNAKLDVSGSFLASTASSIKFADGSFFSATYPEAPPLLTINVPLGLQFGKNPGEITVQGSGHNLQVSRDGQFRTKVDRTNRNVGLQVQPGNTLALVGGNVELNGGNLTAEGGRIELGSVQGEGMVSLNRDRGFALGYEGVPNFGDIQLLARSSVETTGAGGGNIRVQGRRFLVDNSYMRADTLGSLPGGSLSVNASESVKIIGIPTEQLRQSGLFSEVEIGATGDGGEVFINTPALRLESAGQVSTSTRGKGNAGALTVRADSVEIIGRATNGTEPFTGLFSVVENEATGRGGNLTIETRQLIGQNNAVIQVQALPTAVGNAGVLTISTYQLRLLDGAQISATTFSNRGANAGILDVNAIESVEVIGASSSASSGLFAQVHTNATGNGGNLSITTKRLTIQDGGRIQVGTRAGSTGQGGSLIVNASESVELSGSSATGNFTSTLWGRSEGAGDAGDVRIETQKLIVRDGALITASGTGKGNAGNLLVDAESIKLDNQGTITATATAGDRGNITLNSPNIQLRHQSDISTNATNTASGGNININTDTLVALENSDITANANQSFGGQVRIDAQGIFGTQFRQFDTPQSDITASSALGSEFSGTVEIQTPGVNPSQGLVQLAENVVNVAGLIENRCAATEGSKFIISGRGGLPPNPSDSLSGNNVWVDLRQPSDVVESRQEKPVQLSNVSSNGHLTTRNTQIVEAQGWAIASNGEVILTATPPTVTPHGFESKPPECSATKEVTTQK